MRLLFLGTGPFAVPTLRRLVQSDQHEALCVVTRPPRGRRGPAAPMALAAEELGVPLWQPETVNSDEAREQLRDFQADLLVVCDYGEILKSETLETTQLGGINLHGSLLPKYRGAAPVQWAVINGDAETGNTVIQMTPGLDAGPILGLQRTEIKPHETAEELEARLSLLGADLVLEVLEQLTLGTAQPTGQDPGQTSRAPRLKKEDGAIDWQRTAVEIHNQVRGLQPWPRADTYWLRENGDPLRLIVHRTRLCDLSVAEQAPGVVAATGEVLALTTGAGLLEILEVQPAGKRKMSAGDFLRGNPIAVGQRFGDPGQ